MNKIIILGCGYVGTNLANYISNNSRDKVYVLGIANEYVDCLNKEVVFIEKRIEQITIEDSNLFNNAIIIDAVGNTNATNNLKKASTMFLQNCANKIELIKTILQFKIRKYVFLSSGGTIYNDSEKPHTEDEKLEPKNIYALEKVTIENYIKIASVENSNFEYLILRLSNPYGGIVSKNKKQGIIDVTIEKLKENKPIEFYGDLNNVRDYIYIEEMSEYIYKIAISEYKNEIYNIGSGKGTSIKEIFDIIEKVYEKKIKININNSETINIKSNILNTNKIKSILNIQNTKNIEENIKK